MFSIVVFYFIGSGAGVAQEEQARRKSQKHSTSSNAHRRQGAHLDIVNWRHMSYINTPACNIHRSKWGINTNHVNPCTDASHGSLCCRGSSPFTGCSCQPSGGSYLAMACFGYLYAILLPLAVALCLPRFLRAISVLSLCYLWYLFSRDCFSFVISLWYLCAIYAILWYLCAISVISLCYLYVIYVISGVAVTCWLTIFDLCGAVLESLTSGVDFWLRHLRRSTTLLCLDMAEALANTQGQLAALSDGFFEKGVWARGARAWGATIQRCDRSWGTCWS